MPACSVHYYLVGPGRPRSAPEKDTLRRRPPRPRPLSAAALRAAVSAGHTQVTGSGAKKDAMQASSVGTPPAPPAALSDALACALPAYQTHSR